MSSADAWVGTEFEGRFQILRLLGEGGMGAVYEARQKFTGKHVALKLVHPMVARSEMAQERFIREAQAPNSIDHPAIVQAFDAGIASDGTPYLALELLDGEDLGHAIDAGHVAPAELVGIGVDVLDALDAAHQAGLVHRDIKPENVFLVRHPDGRRQVKLLDFGITRQVGEGSSKLTGTGTILGTPLYMSPEQARGEPVDHRADVWSVGAMLFHGLAGRPPFGGDNYNVIIVAILTQETPTLASLRSDLPPELCAAIDRSLAKDPQQRWQSAREMQAALAACQTNAPALPGAASFGTAATLASHEVSAATAPTHPGPAPTEVPAVAPPAPAASVPTPPAVAAPVAMQPASRPEKKSSLPLVLGIGGAVLGTCLITGVAAMFLMTGDPEDVQIGESTPPAVVEDLPEDAIEAAQEAEPDADAPPANPAEAADEGNEVERAEAVDTADYAELAGAAEELGRQLEQAQQQRNEALRQAERQQRQAEEAQAQAEALRNMTLANPALRCIARCTAQRNRCRRRAGPNRGQKQQCNFTNVACLSACNQQR